MKNRLNKLKSLNLRKNGVYGKECKTLLHLTCKYSGLKLVKYCIEVLKQSPSHLSKKKKNTVLHYASKSNHLGSSKYLLKLCPKLLNKQNHKKQTALVLASKYNHTKLTIFLLKSGADSSIPDKKGWTVGHWAAFHGQFEVLQYLASTNFDFSIKSNRQENILHISAWNGDIKCFDLLLNRIPANQIADRGSIIEYCKGNWELMIWIFDNKILKIQGFEKILYKIEAPIEVFILGKMGINVYFVLMYDRQDMLEYLIREKEVDVRMLKVLKNSLLGMCLKCRKVIDRALRWEQIKGLLYWFTLKVPGRVPKSILIELLQYIS